MSNIADDADVLSDVDDDAVAAETLTLPADDRINKLTAELESERRARAASDAALSDLQSKFNRLKTLAHDALKKRDEIARDRDAALSSTQTLKSEIDAASQLLTSGVEKISSKIPDFRNLATGTLPKSEKYSGLSGVAYGVVKRTNEIVDELIRQVDLASNDRDRARGEIEQRNVEIAIEVSQLEASIAGLKEDVSKKNLEIERLEKELGERDVRISELRELVEFRERRVGSLEAKLEAQRPVVSEQLSYVSKVYGQIYEIVKMVDVECSEHSDSIFMSNEMDLDDNLRTCLEGAISAYELAKVAVEKVKVALEDKREEVKGLNDKVDELLNEKQHIGTLLRSALLSKTTEVRQVAEEGLREAGIDLRLNSNGEESLTEVADNDVYVLAGALENTVKESQVKIIELQHLVEALRAESSLLKGRLDVHAKEIVQLKHHIKELEEKERLANENVEGLMMDITVAEEEISRWKMAAEQEAAAGRAVEQDFKIQLSALQKELEDAKQAIVESENKLKFKEETAAAAMAARDAAENSLKLADLRSARLRERLEELTRQLEQTEREDPRSRNGHRYMCWPWQWLGLNSVGYPQPLLQQSNNEMELSEPLI